MVPELRKRIDFHLTRFRQAHDQVGRAWVTIDGEEVLDCSFGRWFQAYTETKAALLKTGEKKDGMAWRKISTQAISDVKAKQVFSEKDFVSSLTRYLEYPVKESLASDDPLIRAFALVDRRVGKRSLEKVKINESEHPLVQIFYRLRLKSYSPAEAGMN